MATLGRKPIVLSNIKPVFSLIKHGDKQKIRLEFSSLKFEPFISNELFDKKEDAEKSIKKYEALFKTGEYYVISEIPKGIIKINSKKYTISLYFNSYQSKEVFYYNSRYDKMFNCSRAASKLKEYLEMSIEEHNGKN